MCLKTSEKRHTYVFVDLLIILHFAEVHVINH